MFFFISGEWEKVEGQQRADYLTAPLIRSEGSDQLDVDWNLVDRVLGAPTVVDWQVQTSAKETDKAKRFSFAKRGLRETSFGSKMDAFARGRTIN